MSFLEELHIVYRSNPVGTAVLIDRIFPARLGCSAQIVKRMGMTVVGKSIPLFIQLVKSPMHSVIVKISRPWFQNGDASR